jgi:hypothetical protein
LTVKVLLRWWLLVSAVLLGLAGSGCKSTESDNVSARPWNSPRGWEHGLPSVLNEGR